MRDDLRPPNPPPKRHLISIGDLSRESLALVGYAAVTGALSWATVALYVGGVAWTLIYDTIYAMQDQRDDAIIGVRSTARRFAAAPLRSATA